MNSKQTKGIWVGIVVIVLVIGAYYFGTVSKKMTVPEVTQNVTVSNKCNADAKNYFDNKWVKPVKASNSSTTILSLKTINLSYKSNYDKTNNSCYVLVNYNFKSTYNFSLSNISSYLTITYDIVDIYKKDKYGKPMTFGRFGENVSYSDGSKDLLFNCNAFGNKCSSVDGFLYYVQPYLSK